MSSHRMDRALVTRPSIGLEVLLAGARPGVIARRPDDIPGETEDFRPATGDLGMVLAELEARDPLFAWSNWWRMLTAAIRQGQPKRVEQLLAVATLHGWA